MEERTNRKEQVGGKTKTNAVKQKVNTFIINQHNMLQSTQLNTKEHGRKGS